MVVTSSLCIGLSRRDSADQHGSAKAVRLALRGMGINPLRWAIALGALTAVMQRKPPAPVWQTVSMLADAAWPVALFTIGEVLARSAIQVRNGKVDAAAVATGSTDVLASRPVPGLTLQRALPPVDYRPVVIVKLIVHSLMV